MKLGQFGTCDVENYGDLLYPVVTKHLLQQKRSDIMLNPYAFLPGVAPEGAGYEARGIQRLLCRGDQHLDALIVGGGDIVRTDTAILASHYQGIYQKRREHNLFGRIRKMILGSGDSVGEFRQRYMRYEAIGPFLIDPVRFPNVGLVAYCSVGVPFAFNSQENLGVSRALNNSAFIYARDNPSRDKLVEAGVTKTIHVAPDLIVTLSDFYPLNEQKRKGQEIFRSHGIDTSKPVLCFQSPPQDSKNLAIIVAELVAYAERTGSAIALLPIGRCHGDDHALRLIEKLSSNRLVYINALTIFDMIAVIAASDRFLGTSMHGNITAFSYGIPHLFGPLDVDKLKGFLDVAELDSRLKLASWAGIGDGLAMLDEFDSEYFSSRAEKAKRRVNDVIDQLLVALERPISISPLDIKDQGYADTTNNAARKCMRSNLQRCYVLARVFG